MTITTTTTAGASAATREQLAELRAAVTGRVSTPDDPTYAHVVSPWNRGVAVTPRIAVEAVSAHDVAQTVRFARRHGLTVTPQATGHGPIEELIGDILVSTRGLDECVVHPEGWARAGAGVKWLRVVQAAAPYGLAPLSGSITDVGVVGYTTGGGLGPMARTYGLASDRVRAFEVVTGDGELRRVTAVEFDLVHQPEFYGGALWFDGADAAAVTERWRTWSATLPEGGTTSLALFRLPPLEGVPEPLAGRLTVSVRYVWTASPAEGHRHLAAMRTAAPLLIDDVRTKPYAQIDSVHTDPLDPMPVREDSILLGAFPAAGVPALMAAAGPGSDSQQFLVEIRQLGGAYRRGGQHPSAFHPRQASYSVLAVGLPGPATDHDHTVLRARLAPWTLPMRLPNFSFSAEQLAAAYDPATRRRLLSAIDAYDPAGVLTVGHALRGTTHRHIAAKPLPASQRETSVHSPHAP
ncbi:MAG TPA: FAD-dependent oxidoreductase [Nocardioidaceae bacterium]|nr:FAD-dependent oxidoreductase [Nocardioidaceae bacterium]